MLLQLRRIRQYQTPEQLRRSSERTIGLEFEEAIEMAYENMQGEVDVKGIKPIHIENRPESAMPQPYSPPDSGDLPISRT